MTTPIALAALVIQNTADQILAIGLDVAQAVGLPVTTWRNGDPTRSYYKYLARMLASLEQQNSAFIGAGFLRYAAGSWLRVNAQDVYGVTPIDATFATPSVTLTNTSNKRYNLAANDLVAKSSASGKTYHSTQAGDFTPGTTLTLTFTADEAGSASSVGPNDVDTLVTTYLGLSIVSSGAAAAADDQDDDSLKQACEDSRGALSPNGPDDAYASVAKNSALTGNVETTRAETFADSDTFDVTLYVAGNAGPVSADALTAVQNALESYATPFCVTPTAVNATAFPQALVCAYSGDNLPPDFVAKGTAAWNTLVNTKQRIGKPLPLSTINFELRNAVPEATNLVITSPAFDITPNENQVITVSTVTITEA